MLVTALFVRRDSIYKAMPNVDAWDEARDARKWPGGTPIVAHPPCGQWGALRGFAKVDPEKKALGPLAVQQVRRWGGVLEHPAHSTLWNYCGLPNPMYFDHCGGWTLPIDQHWWGHLGSKRTFLYIVGCVPRDVPEIPFSIAKIDRKVEDLSKRQREATPPLFAEWLIELARRCHV